MLFCNTFYAQFKNLTSKIHWMFQRLPFSWPYVMCEVCVTSVTQRLQIKVRSIECLPGIKSPLQSNSALPVAMFHQTGHGSESNPLSDECVSCMQRLAVWHTPPCSEVTNYQEAPGGMSACSVFWECSGAVMNHVTFTMMYWGRADMLCVFVCRGLGELKLSTVCDIQCTLNPEELR